MNPFEGIFFFTIRQSVSLVSARFYEVLMASILFIISRFIEITFLIEDFSYLLIFFLFLTGVIIFHALRFLSTKTGHQKILLGTSIIVLIMVPVVLITGDTLFWPQSAIDHVLTLAQLISASVPTQFHDFLPFFYPLPALTFFLLVLIYYVHPFSGIFFFFLVFSTFSVAGLDYYLADFTPYIGVILLSFWIYSTIQSFGDGTNDQNKKIRRMIILYSISGAIGLIFLSSLLVKVTGTYTYSKRYHILTTITLNSEGYLFSINRAGYGGSGSLGGSIYPTNRTALRVKAERPYYLRGQVFTHYTGKSWEHNLRYEDSIHPFDTEDNSFDYSDTMIVSETYIDSSSLFTPLGTTSVKIDEEVKKDGHDIFILGRRKRSSKKYRVYLLGEAAYHTDTKILPQNIYLALPDTISRRTRDLLKDITEDVSTDEERIEAVKNYLKTGYSYSTIVSHDTSYTDFVDNFLFNEKRGYCTSFATSAAVLLRLAHIECRYVEGFNMDDNRDESGVYEVTEAMAHAWVEYRLSPSSPWHILDAVPLDYSTPVYNNYWALRYGMEYTPLPSPDLNGNPAVDDTPTVPSLPAFTLPQGIVKLFRRNWLSLLMFPPLITLLFLYLKSRVRLYLLFRSETIVPLYRFIKKRIQAFGYCSVPSMTLHESLDLIDDEKLKKHLARLFQDYLVEVYGKRRNRKFTPLDMKELLAQLRKKCTLIYFIQFILM